MKYLIMLISLVMSADICASASASNMSSRKFDQANSIGAQVAKLKAIKEATRSSAIQITQYMQQIDQLEAETEKQVDQLESEAERLRLEADQLDDRRDNLQFHMKLQADQLRREAAKLSLNDPQMQGQWCEKRNHKKSFTIDAEGQSSLSVSKEKKKKEATSASNAVQSNNQQRAASASTVVQAVAANPQNRRYYRPWQYADGDDF